MSLKKIIFGVIVATALVVFAVYFVQKNNQKNGSNKEDSQDDRKKATLYKLTKDNCKLGIYSIEGEVVDRDFYRICSNKLTMKIDPKSCRFGDCPLKDEVNISDWVFYKNEKYKFSIKYPKGWEVSTVEPEGGLKKLEVLFSNKKCFDQNFVSCPSDFYGYRIIFYENNLQQAKIDGENIDFYERSSRVEKIKLFSGENIFLYVNDEFNESNFKDNINVTLPGAQTILAKNNYSIYIMGDFRGNVDILEYFRASIKTLGFE